MVPEEIACKIVTYTAEKLEETKNSGKEEVLVTKLLH